MEDELDALKPAFAPPELHSWNIEDLDAYKDRLNAEISRIDEEIKTKKDVSAQAESLFKS